MMEFTCRDTTLSFKCDWQDSIISMIMSCLRSVQKSLTHPAGPGQKLILGGAIWVVEGWLQLVKSQLKSVVPHLIYKSLCDSSTQNMPDMLSTLGTGPSCLPFPFIEGHQTSGFVNRTISNRKNTTKSVPMNGLIFMFWVFGSHKLLYLRCWRTDLSCGSCDLKSCCHPSTTRMAPPNGLAI